MTSVGYKQDLGAAQFELPEDRKIKEVSKGMRAKIALSLAMAHAGRLGKYGA